MKKMMRKMLILGVLLAVPGVVSLTATESAHAAICCSVCDTNLENCLFNCPPEVHNCPNLCERTYTRCEQNCTPGC